MRILSTILLLFVCSICSSQDYIISVKPGSCSAAPRVGSDLQTKVGDASTVIQFAINSLSKSDGGEILLTAGIYNLLDETTITGIGNSQPSTVQIYIHGAGYSTKLIQNTAGKNGIVVKNKASVKISDLYIYTGKNSKSCLLFDNTGANEISVFGGTIENLFCQSNSITSPAVYLKNFFDLIVPSLYALNPDNDGLLIENNSVSKSYGNSHFGFIRAGASPKHAGLRFNTVDNNHVIDMLTFANYECISGGFGIYSEGLMHSTFNFVDIEYMANPIYFTGTSASWAHETRGVKILSGYLLPSAGGTAITNTLYTGGNVFNVHIEADKTSIPILDQQNYRPANSYNLTVGTSVNVSNISILNKATTPLSIIK